MPDTKYITPAAVFLRGHRPEAAPRLAHRGIETESAGGAPRTSSGMSTSGANAESGISTTAELAVSAPLEYCTRAVADVAAVAWRYLKYRLVHCEEPT